MPLVALHEAVVPVNAEYEHQVPGGVLPGMLASALLPMLASSDESSLADRLAEQPACCFRGQPAARASCCGLAHRRVLEGRPEVLLRRGGQLRRLHWPLHGRLHRRCACLLRMRKPVHACQACGCSEAHCMAAVSRQHRDRLSGVWDSFCILRPPPLSSMDVHGQLCSHRGGDTAYCPVAKLMQSMKAGARSCTL